VRYGRLPKPSRYNLSPIIYSLETCPLLRCLVLLGRFLSPSAALIVIAAWLVGRPLKSRDPSSPRSSSIRRDLSMTKGQIHLCIFCERRRPTHGDNDVVSSDRVARRLPTEPRLLHDPRRYPAASCGLLRVPTPEG
jgi:hypothetical protein